MTDDELVRAALEGKKPGANRLVDVYWPRVYGFCYRLCRNRSDAEDLTQEVFLRGFKELKNYRQDGRFKSWIFRIATNSYFDVIRSKRSRGQETQDSSNVWARPGRPQRMPDESAQIHETVANVSEEINGLPAEQRIALMLRVVEKMDYA